MGRALKYSVYIITCETPNHRYVGMTGRSVWVRIGEHCDEQGSNFTRQHGVADVEVFCTVETKKEALDIEKRVTLDLDFQGFVVAGGPWTSRRPGVQWDLDLLWSKLRGNSTRSKARSMVRYTGLSFENCRARIRRELRRREWNVSGATVS